VGRCHGDQAQGVQSHEGHITQEEFAQAIGVARQTIISIERGNYNPSLELAFKIARHFEAKIEDIFIYR